MLGRNSQIFKDVSVIKADIETMGYHGGNKKKGGYIEVFLENISAVNWNTTVVQDHKTCELGNLQKIKIVLKGDGEIRNFHKIISQWKEYLDYQLGEIDYVTTKNLCER